MTEFTHDLAIVVGIADYSVAVGPLTTPADDARAVAALLEERYGYEVLCLLDADAHSRRILAAIRLARRRLDADSRLLFYFAGHGTAHTAEGNLEGPKGYLVPHSATVDAATHLPMETVYRELSKVPCRHQLVILDCCFSGAFRWASLRPMVTTDGILYEERFRHLLRHPAHQVLTSAAHDQFAFDTGEQRRGRSGQHSPFAASLLEGLGGAADRYPEGGDGVITLAELYSYLQDELIPHQTPRLWPLPRHGAGEFLFVPTGLPLALPRAEEVAALDASTNPYRGLSAYGPEDEALFFGREREIEELLELVQHNPLTVVTGPSGSGKSSLVAAGLLPRLRRLRATVISSFLVRPTGHPFNELIKVLPTHPEVSPPNADGLAQDSSVFGRWLENWCLSNPSKSLVIVIDQFEEVINLEVNPQPEEPPIAHSTTHQPGHLFEESSSFILSLGCTIQIIESLRLPARLAICIRVEFLDQLAYSPLKDLMQGNVVEVNSLGRSELSEIILGPAQARELFYSSYSLVANLISETINVPGGLALLSYALEQLYLSYIRSGRGDRTISWDDYRAVGYSKESVSLRTHNEAQSGGLVERAIHARADFAYEYLGPKSRYMLRSLLLRMVNINHGQYTRRTLPINTLKFHNLEDTLRAEEILSQLSGANYRLLVTRTEQRGGSIPNTVVEPAHEKLLTAWPRLTHWIQEEATRIPLLHRLTDDASEWFHSSKNPSKLWHDTGKLERSKQLLNSRNVCLTSLEDSFLTLSTAKVSRSLYTQRTLYVGGLLVALLSTLVLYSQAKVSEKRLLNSIIQSLANESSLQLKEGNHARSLLLARQAFNYDEQIGSPNRARTDQALRNALDSQESGHVLIEFQDRLFHSFSSHPNEEILATHSGRHVSFIDNNGNTLYDFTSEQRIAKLSFTADGSSLITAIINGETCILELAWQGSEPLKHCLQLSDLGDDLSPAISSLAEQNIFFHADLLHLTPYEVLATYSSPVFSILVRFSTRDVSGNSILSPKLQLLEQWVAFEEVVKLLKFNANSIGAYTQFWAYSHGAIQKVVSRTENSLSISLLGNGDIDGWFLAATNTGNRRAVTRDSFNVLVEENKPPERRLVPGYFFSPGEGVNVGPTAFSEDEVFLIISYSNGDIVCRNLARGTDKVFYQGPEKVHEVSFSSNGQDVFSIIESSEGRYFLKRWHDPCEVGNRSFYGSRTILHLDSVAAVTSSTYDPSEPRRLLLGRSDGWIDIWDEEEGILHKHYLISNSRVDLLTFAPDGKFFLSVTSGQEEAASRDRDFRKQEGFDLDIGKRREFYLVGLVYSRNPDIPPQILSNLNSKPRYFLDVYFLHSSMKEEGGRIRELGSSICPDEAFIVADQWCGILWSGNRESRNRQELPELEAIQSKSSYDLDHARKRGNLHQEVFTPVPGASSIRVPLIQSYPRELRAIAVHPDGDYLAAMGKSALLFRPKLGAELFDTEGWERVSLPGHFTSTDFPVSADFSPDGRWLAAAGRIQGQAAIWLWAIVDGELVVSTLGGSDVPLTEVKFSHDSELIISQDESGKVYVISLRDRHLKPIVLTSERLDTMPLAINSDSSKLFSGLGKGRGVFWNLRTEDLSKEACLRVSQNLPIEEWQLYVSSDLTYQPTCWERLPHRSVALASRFLARSGDLMGASKLETASRVTWRYSRGKVTNERHAFARAVDFAESGRIDWSVALLKEIGIEELSTVATLSELKKICSLSIERGRAIAAVYSCNSAVRVFPRHPDLLRQRMTALLMQNYISSALADAHSLSEIYTGSDRDEILKEIALLESGMNPLRPGVP